MRPEQPIKLSKLRQKMRVKVVAPKTGLNPTIIITGRPKAALFLRFYLFVFVMWCVKKIENRKKIDVNFLCIVCAFFSN